MNFKRTNNNDYSNYEINMRAENLFKTHSGVLRPDTFQELN